MLGTEGGNDEWAVLLGLLFGLWVVERIPNYPEPTAQAAAPLYKRFSEGEVVCVVPARA